MYLNSRCKYLHDIKCEVKLQSITEGVAKTEGFAKLCKRWKNPWKRYETIQSRINNVIKHYWNVANDCNLILSKSIVMQYFAKVQKSMIAKYINIIVIRNKYSKVWQYALLHHKILQWLCILNSLSKIVCMITK